MKVLNSSIDSILGVPYLMVEIADAKRLSDELKRTLDKREINYSKFNSALDKNNYFREDRDAKTETNPPREIYEYQPFCFLEDEKEDLYLMDGFRRLLWYNTPDIAICARVYKRKDLTDSQLLQLLVHLNHFKFYGGGDYEERGFALLLNTLFDINLFKFREAFDGYLSNDSIKETLCGNMFGVEDKNNKVKERIVTSRFIPDMKFLQALSDIKSCRTDKFGVLIYTLGKGTDKLFDADQFKKLVSGNEIISGMMAKYDKMDDDARRAGVFNQLIDLYKNTIKQMLGEKTGKTYAEILKEVKEWSAKLQKDKNYVKLTNMRDSYIADRYMKKAFAEGKEIKFKLVIYPQKNDEYWSTDWNKKEASKCLPPQVRDDVKLLDVKKATHWSDHGVPIPEIGFTENGIKYMVGKKMMSKMNYNEMESEWSKNGDRETYDVDLFMEVSKAEFKAFDWRKVN